MDSLDDLPPSIQDRLPIGPDLTDWLLVELDRGQAAAVQSHVLGCDVICRGPEETIAWLTMMRSFVLKHQAGPTYVTNVIDPTGPDVHDGWHCQECGLDRDGPIEEWPCEVLVMLATFLWYTQRPNLPVAWAWTASEDRLIWVRETEGQTIGRQTTVAEREPVSSTFTTYEGKDPDGDALNEHRGGTCSRSGRR